MKIWRKHNNNPILHQTKPQNSELFKNWFSRFTKQFVITKNFIIILAVIKQLRILLNDHPLFHRTRERVWVFILMGVSNFIHQTVRASQREYFVCVMRTFDKLPWFYKCFTAVLLKWLCLWNLKRCLLQSFLILSLVENWNLHQR